METEHFQTPFRVITLGSIQFKNNETEKPPTKELTAWKLSKLHAIRQLKNRLKMIIQTEHFRESSCKPCKTAVVVEKKLAALFGLPPWEFEGKVLPVLFRLLEKI